MEIYQRKTHQEYTHNMHSHPIFPRPEAVRLRIEVRANQSDATFETDLCCDLSHCGKTVDIDSDGPKTVQNVSCPDHGFLVAFPHQAGLGEFIRRSANAILAMNGRELIDAGAAFIIGNEQFKPESMN